MSGWACFNEEPEPLYTKLPDEMLSQKQSKKQAKRKSSAASRKKNRRWRNCRLLETVLAGPSPRKAIMEFVTAPRGTRDVFLVLEPLVDGLGNFC